MVKITKAEKKAIMERFPDAHIRRTMKQRSERGNYYCEESRKVMEFLERYRKERCLSSREGGC